MLPLNVTDHGAVGDGSHDDTDAFTSWVGALNSAAGGDAGRAEGYVPPGHYVINSAWPTITQSNVAITVSPAAMLDFSGATDSTKLIVVEGSQSSTEVKLAASAKEGDTELRIDSGGEEDFTGGYVLVYSSDYFDPGRTDTQVGEQALCTGTSAGVIELWTPLAIGPYTTAASAAVKAITHNVGFSLRGGTIIGSGAGHDQEGIYLDTCRDARVDEVTIRGCDAVGITVLDSIAVIVRGCTVCDSTNPNVGYGVEWVNTATDCLVVDSYFKNCRHATTTAATSSRDGVALRCGARDCTLWGSASNGDGFDTHACGLDIFYEFCKVYGASGQGINIECPRARVTGCEVWRAASNGIAFHNESAQPTDYQCTGNKVYCPLGASNGSGIQYAHAATSDAGQSIRQVVIANNMVYASAGFGIGAYADSGYRAANVVIGGNTVSTPGGNGIEAEYLDGAVITGNIVRGAGSDVYAIKLYACTEAVVVGNSVQATGSSVGVYVEAGSSNVVVASNVITDCSEGVSLDDTCATCTVHGNDASRCATPISLGDGDGHLASDNQSGPGAVTAPQ